MDTQSSMQRELGIVRAIKGYHIAIEGLPGARVHDVLFCEDGVRALVSGIKHDALDAVVLDNSSVTPGQHFFLDEGSKHIYVGDRLFGRVVNPLCDPVDAGHALPPRNVQLKPYIDAGTISKRAKIVHQLHTGYTLTDVVLPIGVGQRQLLMGPPQSGTDAFVREVILHQENVENVVCVYVMVGKHISEIQRTAHGLFATSAKHYTILITTTARDLAPMHGIAPAVGLQVAEWYASLGKNVLLILDDIYTHAKYLREMALLEGRLPGRESYPGDIFFQQAHLIERAGSFFEGGSITMLPIVQTNIDSYTDLITTNIMGTTDGHLAFSPLLHAQGIFPPIVDSESVTRVGRHTQTLILKQLSTAIGAALARYREQERVAQFGQLSDSSRHELELGRSIQAILAHMEGSRLPLVVHAALAALPFTSFNTADIIWNTALVEKVAETIRSHASYGSLIKAVEEGKDLVSFYTFLEKEFVPACLKVCQT